MKVLTLLYGLLAISIFSSNYLIQERIEEDFSKMDYSEREDNSKDSHNLICLPDYVASFSSIQINIDIVLNILIDKPFVTEAKCWHDFVCESHVISFLRILFQFIMAPNAP